MIMSWIFTGIVALSLLFSFILGRGSELAGAITQGAQNGIALVFSIAGSVCLWCGVGKLMDKVGVTAFLSKCIRPILHKIFPSTKTDQKLAGFLTMNICANFLGLGNAATPMGVQAAQRIASYKQDGVASNELCRLVVLNTASIQLIPATVAAVRASLGCKTPFDILPAVWITSLCSAGVGLIAAWLLGRLWRK